LNRNWADFLVGIVPTIQGEKTEAKIALRSAFWCAEGNGSGAFGEYSRGIRKGLSPVN
jgi:hypothetical protein